MSDNLKRYLAIVAALKQLLPAEPQGNQRRHLCVLAAFISGVVGSRRCSLSAVASKMPSGKQRESRIKRLARWLSNDQVTTQKFFLPFAEHLLAALPAQPIVLVMDGSNVGRGCLALVVSVLYQKRALPLCWLVVKGKKGHFGQEAHVELVRQVAALMPKQRPVLFLGDGEFDGCGLLKELSELGWGFVCRTARNVQMCDEQEWFSFADLSVQPGELLSIAHVGFTRENYQSVLAIACWQEGYDQPLFLVSNLELAAEAVDYYKQRFRIETFFSDQKCRGFHLAHSRISDPERMSRLLIASCLAYIWLVYLGALVASKPSWLRQIHRTDRCDLSLFQLGFAWLEQCLDQGREVAVAFTMPWIHQTAKSVR